MLEALAIVVACIGILFALKKYCLPGAPRQPQTRHLTVDLPHSNKRVWKAIFAHTRFLGPITSFDQARAGDAFEIESIAGTGSWAEITKLRIRVLDCEPARYVRFEVLEQDGEPFVGGNGSWQSYKLEVCEIGTRLTSSLHVTPRSAMETYFIGKALDIDMRKINARLEEPTQGAPIAAVV